MAPAIRADHDRVVDGGRCAHDGGPAVLEAVSKHAQIGTSGGWRFLEDGGAIVRCDLSGEDGQTFTETAMLLGILTAIIIGLTGIIVPGFLGPISQLVRHMLVFVGSAS